MKGEGRKGGKVVWKKELKGKVTEHIELLQIGRGLRVDGARRGRRGTEISNVLCTVPAPHN